MDVSTYQVYYSIIDFSYRSGLGNGDVILIVWPRSDKLGVSMLSKSRGYTHSLICCNALTQYASLYNFIDDIHVVPCIWEPNYGIPTRWIKNTYGEDAVYMEWTLQGLRILEV